MTTKSKSKSKSVKPVEQVDSTDNSITIELTEEQLKVLKGLALNDPSKSIEEVGKKLLLEIISNNWRLK